MSLQNVRSGGGPDRRAGGAGDPAHADAIRRVASALDAGTRPSRLADEVWRAVRGGPEAQTLELETSVHFITHLVEGVRRRVPVEEVVDGAIPDDGLDRVVTCLDLTLLERGAARFVHSYEELSERATDALRQAGLDVARAVAEALGDAGSA